MVIRFSIEICGKKIKNSFILGRIYLRIFPYNTMRSYKRHYGILLDAAFIFEIPELNALRLLRYVQCFFKIRELRYFTFF